MLSAVGSLRQLWISIISNNSSRSTPSKSDRQRPLAQTLTHTWKSSPQDRSPQSPKQLAPEVQVQVWQEPSCQTCTCSFFLFFLSFHRLVQWHHYSPPQDVCPWQCLSSWLLNRNIKEVTLSFHTVPRVILSNECCWKSDKSMSKSVRVPKNNTSVLSCPSGYSFFWFPTLFGVYLNKFPFSEIHPSHLNFSDSSEHSLEGFDAFSEAHDHLCFLRAFL